MGGVVQVVTRAMGSGRCSFAHSLLTSCCVARFLTGCGLVLVRGPGVGSSWSRGHFEKYYFSVSSKLCLLYAIHVFMCKSCFSRFQLPQGHELGLCICAEES